MFDRDLFIKDSKERFKRIYSEKEINARNNNLPTIDFGDVLGDVIEYYFKKYDHDDVVKTLNYDINELESNYEFDEENFDDYFGSSCIIKNYKEALAYYSLNECFMSNCQEELEAFIDAFE